MTKPTGRPRGRPRKDGLPPMPKPKPPRNIGGRPRLAIDPQIVQRAASIGCNPGEIAAVCNVSERTFTDRMKDTPALAEAYSHGQREGRATLRRLQWQSAVKGNVTMQIWLGKNMLGQTDKQELTTLTPEEIRRVADMARTEASRRGLSLDDADRPSAGTLPH